MQAKFSVTTAMLLAINTPLWAISDVAYGSSKADDYVWQDAASGRSTDQSLQQAKDDFSIAIFTVPGCQACSAQKRALSQFNLRHGWQVREINAQEHSQLAKRFNVSSAPATIVIRHTTNQWLLLSVGSTSLASIEQKAFNAVRHLCKTS